MKRTPVFEGARCELHNHLHAAVSDILRMRGVLRLLVGLFGEDESETARTQR